MFFLASVVVVLALFLNSEDKAQPDPEFLSTDLYFRVSELVISVPAVALQDMTLPPDNRNPLPRFDGDGPLGTARRFATREYKTALRELAADSAEPAEVATIKLYFGYYGGYGEYRISQEICPKLSKEWSQKACANELRKELKFLPKVFYLSTRSGLSRFRSHSFSGVPDITVADLLDAINPILPTAKMACAADQASCYAALLVSDELFAVWHPSCSNITDEHCKIVLEAQGAEIRKFVVNELRIE